MKKLTVVFFTSAIVLGISACGSNLSSNEFKVLDENGQTVIEYQGTKYYQRETDSAESGTGKNLNNSEEPESIPQDTTEQETSIASTEASQTYTEIIITPDNFWDYFEYVEYVPTEENAFGEEYYSSDVVCTIRFKEELKDKIVPDVNDYVAVQYNYKSQYEAAAVNTTTGTFEWTGIISSDSDVVSDDMRVPIDTELHTACAALCSDGNTYYQRFIDIVVTRTEGSIFLYDN